VRRLARRRLQRHFDNPRGMRVRSRRVAGRPGPVAQQAVHAFGQRQTVVFAVPVAAMIAFVPKPSALSRTIRERQTCFCGALRSAAMASSLRRPLANLRRIPCRLCSHNSSFFLQVGASGKLGAVHPMVLMIMCFSRVSSIQIVCGGGRGVHPIKWKAKYGGLDVSEARRLKTPESDNVRLKKLLVDTMLDNAVLKNLLGKP
jgi:putative transposase